MTAEDVGTDVAEQAGEPPAALVARRPLPWWARALVVFAASRVVSTLLFLWVGAQATSASRAGPRPTLVTLSTAWDGQWYWLISETGYPAHLPITTSGVVDTNQWAFLPLWPYLVKVVSFGDLAMWPVAALVLSVLFGFGSAVLLALLLRGRIGDARAGFAVAVFSFAPLSFLLQTAYAESLGLFLLLAALCLLDRRRYLAAAPVAVALAFTRPEALPLALTAAVHLALRVVAARRGGERVPSRELAAGVLLVAVCVVAGFAWPVIAALGTGVPDAYFQTEQAWRALWMPGREFTYFAPWLFAADFWLGRFGPFAGPLVLAGLLLAFVAALFAPAVRRLGAVVRLWSASYALYLLAVFFPQSSLFRLLMPMAPLAGAITPRPLAARVAVIAGCIGLQALWLWCTYGPFQVYWSVP